MDNIQGRTDRYQRDYTKELYFLSNGAHIDMFEYCCGKSKELDEHRSYNYLERTIMLDPGWMCMFDGPIIDFEYCMFCGKKLNNIKL